MHHFGNRGTFLSSPEGNQGFSVLSVLSVYQKIIDPKCGQVVVVGRIWCDKEQKKRIKINDLLQVDGQFMSQLVNGEMPTFKLSSAIEHIGGPDAGHYIIHLCHDDEIFTINDDKEILKGKKRDLQKSHIFIYTLCDNVQEEDH